MSVFNPGRPKTLIDGVRTVIGNDPRGLVPISDPTLLTIPTYDGSNQAVHPSVVHIPGGWNGYSFWMAFTPYPNSDASKENPSIIASNDGITWEVPAGLTNPVVDEPVSSNNSDPHLEYDYQNDVLALFYQWNGDGTERKLTSSDGVTWSAETDLGNLGTSVSFVKNVHNVTSWTAFSANTERPYRRDSSDGTTFGNLQYLTIPTRGQAGHMWVGMDDLGYHMLLQQAPRNRYWENSNIYYGFSLDGYDWRLFPSPVIGRQVSGEREQAVYCSCLVNLGDYYRVYYSSWAEDGTWGIGYFDAMLSFDALSWEQGSLTLPLFVGEEIRDTSDHYAFTANLNNQLYIQDWNRYRHRALMFYNGLDQDLTLKVDANLRGDKTRQDLPDQLRTYNATTPAKVNLALPKGFSPVLVTESDFPLLGQKLPTEILMRVSASVAPTSGDLTMKLIMWN